MFCYGQSSSTTSEWSFNSTPAFVTGITLPSEIVHDDRESSISYSGPWTQDTYFNRYSGTQSYSDAVGGTASFTFRGTQVGYMYALQNNLGVAQITIDGKCVDTIDEYAPVSIGQQVATYPGLSDGVHTITVEVVGTKNNQSAGNSVVIDAFVIGHSSSPLVSDDQDPAIKYSRSWLHSLYPNRHGGTQTYANQPGETASFTFSGTQVGYMYALQTNLGVAQISIDGKVVDTIDEYAPVFIGQQVATYPGLSDGVHTITVEVVGTKNNQSAGTWVVVDAFIIGHSSSPLVSDDQDPVIKYSRSWLHSLYPNRHGGTQTYANQPGETASFTFRGTQVGYMYALQTNLGVAQISIDGKVVDTIDEYAPVFIGQQVATYPGLSDGVHTITVEVAGTKNNQSAGTWVVVDAFVAPLSSLTSIVSDLTYATQTMNGQLLSIASSINDNNASDASIATTVNGLGTQMLSLAAQLTRFSSQLSSVKQSLAVLNTITLPNFVDAEIPAGARNGTNMTFSLADVPNPASSLKLFKNGLLMTPTLDYSLAGNVIKFPNANITPEDSDSIVAYYRY